MSRVKTITGFFVDLSLFSGKRTQYLF
jgi:hypothetical protein